ncbi:MAG TPA: glycosyltransferase, partial [Fibrobacteria bacterium]|nr:glycosyltransferase [Fibrobacteria bacterium]
RSAPPNVTFLGRADSSVLLSTMQKARAFLFAAEEDFGIAPVEAQSCGLPVIAFGRGGALETIRGGFPNGSLPPHPTGVFFREQTVPSLLEAIRYFELNESVFSSADCVSNARRFGPQVFRDRFLDEIRTCWNAFQLREGYSFPDW